MVGLRTRRAPAPRSKPATTSNLPRINMSVAPLQFLNITAPSFLPRPARSADANRLIAGVGRSSAGGESTALICFCHLSWHGVWQRPQQFLSRLARKRLVLFVETYCSDIPVAEYRLEGQREHPNVTVMQMHLPASRWADGDFIDRERRRLLTGFRGNHPEYDNPILWFYDPMAVTAFAGHCDERAIVYDCMDELSQFKGAHPALAQRERELLTRADVVFCGGQKMRAKRLPFNRNTHFYGTGVDVAHFGRALDPTFRADPDIARLGSPILGYFGVIDERIDYALLTSLADALRHCHVVMVGPTAKVDPADLPQRPNLHWVGRRDYAELPAIAKAFSVCLMPFALNAATEYINPTKALEYMATGRPVVSTAIPEVISNFAPACVVARSPEEFIAACRQCLTEPDETRRAAGLRLARENTWDYIVAQMEAHLPAAMRAHATQTAPFPVPNLRRRQEEASHV
jgi:glycosyltransferase involved in cell wall biosynthesis